MTLPALPLPLPLQDRLLLEDLLSSRRTPDRVRLRCQILLLAADGLPNATIAARLGITRSTVLEWRRRAGEGGASAVLEEATEGVDPRLRQLRAYLELPPPDGAPAWTVRALAKATGCSPATVQRLLDAADLRMNPRRPTQGLESNLLQGIVDLAGLYLHSPYHTLALEVDPRGVDTLQAFQAPRPGEPAWLLNLHLRSIEGLRQMDGRSTYYSSSYWAFVTGLAPRTPGNLIWCLTDTPLNAICLQHLSRDHALHFTLLDGPQEWLHIMKATVFPALQAHIHQGRCPSVTDTLRALETFIRDEAQDPLQWSASA